MAALVVFAIVAAGSLPLLIGAARAAVNGKMQSQAKQLVQAQMDAMRNLPFHVDATKGQFIDVLDKYFPNKTTTAPTVTGMTWLTTGSGYVSSTRLSSSDRIVGEPLTGGFYRAVLTQGTSNLFPAGNQFASYRIIVDTQFLDSSGNPVSPPTGYDTTTSPADSPPAAMLGVTVTAAWTQGGTPKSFTSATRISNARPIYIISEHGRATAVTVQSKLASNNGAILSLTASDVTADGGSATGTTATVNALAMDALIGGSTETSSQALTLSAPPDVPAVPQATDTGPHYLSTGDCTYVCFGPTSTSGGFLKVDNGLPMVGDPNGQSVWSDVLGTGNGTYRGFSYSNEPSNSALQYASGMPLVFLRDVGGSAPLTHSAAKVNTTSGTPHSATVTVKSNVGVLDLFPTSFTPAGRGVLEVWLNSASLQCDVTTSSSGSSATTATASWNAQVYYWNGSSYVELGGADLTNGSGPNLSTVALSTLYVGKDSNNVTHYLGDYISGITGLTSMPAASVGTASIQATIPSIVSVTSTATRASDPTSQINVQVGTLSCSAGDQR